MSGYDLAKKPGRDCDIGTGCTFDPTVRWGKGVHLGDNVHVAQGTTFYDDASIGANSWIGPGCSIGEPTIDFYRDRENYEGNPTRVGQDSILRNGTIISAGSKVGDRFQSGPYVAIRENTRIGDDCAVGNNSDIQYGVDIGDFTRLHSFVAVGSGTRIGPFCWIHPFVVFTNSAAAGWRDRS